MHLRFNRRRTFRWRQGRRQRNWIAAVASSSASSSSFSFFFTSRMRLSILKKRDPAYVFFIHHQWFWLLLRVGVAGTPRLQTSAVAAAASANTHAFIIGSND